VGQAAPQVGEALGAKQQLANNEQRPALADQVEGVSEAAGVAVCAGLGDAAILPAGPDSDCIYSYYRTL
jgi:hypothetical protein